MSEFILQFPRIKSIKYHNMHFQLTSFMKAAGKWLQRLITAALISTSVEFFVKAESKYPNATSQSSQETPSSAKRISKQMEKQHGGLSLVYIQFYGIR